MRMFRFNNGRVAMMLPFDAQRLEETGGGKRLTAEEAAEHDLMLREIEDTSDAIEDTVAPVPVAADTSARKRRNTFRKTL